MNRKNRLLKIINLIVNHRVVRFGRKDNRIFVYAGLRVYTYVASAHTIIDEVKK